MQGSIAYLSSSLTVTCCRIWTACLWYSNWACTSAESWLTCSICRWMEKSCLSYQVNTLKQYCPYIHHLLPLDIRVPGSPVFRLTLQDLHQGLLTSAKSLGLWPVTQSYLFTASQPSNLHYNMTHCVLQLSGNTLWDFWVFMLAWADLPNTFFLPYAYIYIPISVFMSMS